jgi:GTP cyclohydrolase I
MGRVDVAYIPNQKVVGLSKLAAHCGNVFPSFTGSRAPHSSDCRSDSRNSRTPRGCGGHGSNPYVHGDARVQKPGSATVTSAMLGVFQDEQKTREEYLNLIRHKPNFF